MEKLKLILDVLVIIADVILIVALFGYLLGFSFHPEAFLL